jgi:hypothetical protein
MADAWPRRTGRDRGTIDSSILELDDQVRALPHQLPRVAHRDLRVVAVADQISSDVRRSARMSPAFTIRSHRPSI